jgi:aspartokinase
MIVQKFGGTSVKSLARIRNVASIIARTAKNGTVVAVVSAMGDTTDYLVKLAHQASNSRAGVNSTRSLLPENRYPLLWSRWHSTVWAPEQYRSPALSSV